MEYVQAFISNISFPNSLDEVYKYANRFDIEQLLGIGFEGEASRYVEWTAPKWCKKSDVVFFMHAKTANVKINKLKRELIKNKELYSDDEFWIIMNALMRARKIHDIYGGKIFAIGKVSGMIIHDKLEGVHWKNSIYAPIERIFLLDCPIDISEFNSDIMISRQSSITPLFGNAFEYIKNLVLKKNHIVEKYFLDAKAEPMPLCKINDENWLEVVNAHRRSFFLEIQFRIFYVDRLLKFLGDNQNFYRECGCKKEGKQITFVDNIIKMNSKYLPVEIKLSIPSEKDIIAQLTSYCNLKQIKLTKDKIISENIYTKNVLVIDTDTVCLYYDCDRVLKEVQKLDSIKTNNDIFKLREKIIDLLSYYN